MAKLFIPLAVIVVALLFASAYFSPEATDARAWRNHVQSERDMLALERAEQWHALQTQHAPVIASAGTVAHVVIIASGVLFLIGVGYALMTALQHWAAGLNWDRRYAMELLRSQERVLIEQARHTHPLPATHYAPHQTITYSPHGTSKPIPGDTPPDEGNADPAALILPDLVELADKLPLCPRSHLAYGVLPGGDLLTLPMAAGFHSLGHGDTRTGKTNWIDGLLVQLHHKASFLPVRILAGDFKRELAATWQRSQLIDGVETDPAAIAEIIDELVNGTDGILERYAMFGRAADERGAIIRNLGDYRRTTGDTAMGVTFLVVDELNAVLEAAGRKSNLGSSLKQALQTGAGAGVYILGGAQYLTAATLGREGSKQFVTRAHFGRADGYALRMMFGQAIDEQARDVLTGQPGRGLIRTVQQQQATPFQALRCTDDDILGVLHLTDDAPTMERATPAPAAPDQEPRTASAPHAPACADSSFSVDFAEQVRRCKQQGMGKIATIELLTGIKRGGGSNAYKDVSSAYDRIIKGETQAV